MPADALRLHRADRLLSGGPWVASTDLIHDTSHLFVNVSSKRHLISATLCLCSKLRCSSRRAVLLVAAPLPKPSVHSM